MVSTYAESLVDVQKDKEDLDEISNELELADEDEKIPYVGSFPDSWHNLG